MSHAAIRNTSFCTVLCQGAGIAAAQSLHNGVDLAAVDVTKLRRELSRQGVRYR